MIPDNGNAESAPERKLYTVIEVAGMLGVTDRKVWNLIYGGDLVARKLGRRVLVRPEDLDAYVESLPTLTPKTAKREAVGA